MRGPVPRELALESSGSERFCCSPRSSSRVCAKKPSHIRSARACPSQSPDRTDTTLQQNCVLKKGSLKVWQTLMSIEKYESLAPRSVRTLRSNRRLSVARGPVPRDLPIELKPLESSGSERFCCSPRFSCCVYVKKPSHIRSARACPSQSPDRTDTTLQQNCVLKKGSLKVWQTLMSIEKYESLAPRSVRTLRSNRRLSVARGPVPRDLTIELEPLESSMARDRPSPYGERDNFLKKIIIQKKRFML